MHQMKQLYRLLLIIGLYSVATNALGQDTEKKLKCSLTGRMLMDGGIYTQDGGNDFGNGTEFNDLRIGLKATYDNWTMRAEIGYAGGKVSLKDVYASYTLKGKHIFRAGQFYEPFSPDMLCSTFDLLFHQSPAIVQALTDGRRMGISYTYNDLHYYACGGFFTDNDVNNLKNASQGYAINGRFVYRPVRKEKALLHIGVVTDYRTPNGVAEDEEGKNTFTYKAPGVSTIDNRNLINAEVNHAQYQIRLSAELLAYYHRFYLQSEYMHAHVKRKNGYNNYRGHGGYVQCAWLLIGNQYTYDEASACPSRPSGRALEICSRFDIVNMDDTKANIIGGAQKDFSIGMNYYFNRHIGVKVNYSYVIPDSSAKEINGENFGIVQARIQFIL